MTLKDLGITYVIVAVKPYKNTVDHSEQLTLIHLYQMWQLIWYRLEKQDLAVTFWIKSSDYNEKVYNLNMYLKLDFNELDLMGSALYCENAKAHLAEKHLAA